LYRAITLAAALAALLVMPHDAQAKDLTAQEIEDLLVGHAWRFGGGGGYFFGPNGQLGTKKRKSDRYKISNGRVCTVMWPVGEHCYRIERRPDGTLVATPRNPGVSGGVMKRFKLPK